MIEVEAWVLREERKAVGGRRDLLFILLPWPVSNTYGPHDTSIHTPPL